MTSSAIHFPIHLIEDLFPFHFAINREGGLTRIGSVLQRVCPTLQWGQPFAQFIQIQRPNIASTFSALQAHLQSLFILEIRNSTMVLKGQVIYLEEADMLLFLGSPWVSDLQALRPLGLELADFAIHDPITDYLVLLQTQRMALSETRQLAEKLKQQRAEIHKALEREKELNDLKSRFITTASHEFRTPLGIISSSAGILQDYATTITEAMRQKHLARIQSAVSRMTGLLEDVLTMSQVENDTLECHLQPIHLADFCQSTVETFRSSTSHQLNFTVESDWVDQRVMLDPSLLHQILKNLLSNAIKYTPEPGTINLTLDTLDGQIRLAICDSGIGIPPSELASVIHPFHRASNIGNTPGTGLGLAITKHCIELHRGGLSITSEIGTGTLVTVTLPLCHALEVCHAYSS